MRICKRYMLTWICLAMLLLSGCQQSKEYLTITESQTWKTMPALTYGQMEYQKLDVLPWFSGRMEATGKGQWAETELGYYSFYSRVLSYADKSNVSLWVPVCDKPNCSHPKDSSRCNAGFQGNTFIIRDGRIYYSDNLGMYPEFYRGEASGSGLFSITLNGSDIRLEYMIEDALLTSAGRTSNLLTAENWFYNSVKANADGTSTATTYCVSDSGLVVLFQESYDDTEGDVSCSLGNSSFGGDYVIRNEFLGFDYYRLENNQLTAVGAAPYMEMVNYLSNYLSGNILRQFRVNEGYYDINLETGDEVFLSKNRLKNSHSFILLPNCIVETTLGSPEHPEGTEQVMEIFDGESWRIVQLPDELLHAASSKPFYTQVIASDRILFTANEGSKVFLYQVMLGGKDLVMECCGRLS